jgi:hypothetical protein
MIKAFIFAALAVTLSTRPARATSFTFNTLPGDTTSSLPISASATFDVEADTLKVTLSNLVVDQTSVGQNVSNIYFTLGNFTTGSVTNMLGGLINLDNYAGTPIVAPTNTSLPSADDWKLTGGNFTVQGSTITGYHLDTLANGNNFTLLGLPNASNIYSNANSSLTNGHGDPFLYSTVVFTMHIDGLTPTTSVSNVSFGFGTGEGDVHGSACSDGCTTTTITTTPEPASMLVIGFGLAVIGLVGGKVRRKA